MAKENMMDMVYMDDMKNMEGMLNIKEMVDIEDKMDMEVMADKKKGWTLRTGGHSGVGGYFVHGVHIVKYR